MVFFPGKIFGIHANYIIAEVEFFEGEDPEEPLDDERQQEQQEVHLLGLNTFLVLSKFFFSFKSQGGNMVKSEIRLLCEMERPFLAEWGSIHLTLVLVGNKFC